MTNAGQMKIVLHSSCVTKLEIIAVFCHGSFFLTFWMSGMTCYLASIITDEKYRGKGYGRLMVDHVKKLAKARGCKAIILDSGMPRKAAHAFYERYGFEKSCYGFELFLK